MTSTSVRDQIRRILEANNHTVAQDHLVRMVDGGEQEVLGELRELMSQGRIAYSGAWEIDGRGKCYADGLTE